MDYGQKKVELKKDLKNRGAKVTDTKEKLIEVPPDACFARFRDDDCGMPPKAVMYYYRSGSRCEVAFWRGCLPNMNMFADEYECVRTCIFVDRAGDEDYHNQNKEEHEDLIATETITTTELVTNMTTTETDETVISNSTAPISSNSSGIVPPTTAAPE